MLFNRVELNETPARVFSGLFDCRASQETFTLKPEAVIHVNDLYGKVKRTGQGIQGILADPADLKEQAAQGGAGRAGKLRISRLISIKRLAAGVSEELNRVFKVLLK